MAHETEKSYADRIEEWLVDTYGRDNVHRDYYLSRTVRYVDFYVNGPLTDFAIEVENDFEAVFKGIGQSLLYAGDIGSATPLIIIPPGHFEEPERTILNNHVTIKELEI